MEQDIAHRMDAQVFQGIPACTFGIPEPTYTIVLCQTAQNAVGCVGYTNATRHTITDSNEVLFD